MDEYFFLSQIEKNQTPWIEHEQNCAYSGSFWCVLERSKTSKRPKCLLLRAMTKSAYSVARSVYASQRWHARQRERCIVISRRLHVQVRFKVNKFVNDDFDAVAHNGCFFFLPQLMHATISIQSERFRLSPFDLQWHWRGSRKIITLFIGCRDFHSNYWTLWFTTEATYSAHDWSASSTSMSFNTFWMPEPKHIVRFYSARALAQDELKR